MKCLPQELKIIEGNAPTTTNAAVTGDYISLKNFHKVWVKFTFKQAVSHQTVCSVYEATNVSAGSAAAITKTMPNWYNQDISASDALTKGTDAATVTLAAGTTDQVVIMEVDPVILSSGFDCIAGHTSASSQATDFVHIEYFGIPRYPASTPPTAITD